MSTPSSEKDPLLQNRNRGQPAIVTRTIASSVALFFGLVLVFALKIPFSFWRWNENLPDDPLAAAIEILKAAPVIVSD
jgi:hypothetical protein